jgi:hypothetical protein
MTRVWPVHSICMGPHHGSIAPECGVHVAECNRPLKTMIRLAGGPFHSPPTESYMCMRCARHWWVHHKERIRCDRCQDPSPDDKLVAVTCWYGCTHRQCQLCGEQTKMEARDGP